MGKFDDIDLSDERDGTAPKKGAPALVWVFFILTVLLVVGLGVLTWYAMDLSKRVDGLDEGAKAATAELEKAGVASKTEDGRLEGRIRSLETRLSALDERVGEVAGDLATFRKEVNVAQAEGDQKLGGLGEKLELKETALTQLIGEVRTDIERTREDAEVSRKTYEKQVGQVSDDFEYIKEELGKKAEKSYLKFLKRDLTKKIDGIAKDVVTVRTDLESKITETERRVVKKFDDLDTQVEATVEKKVEKATAMDFVPTEGGE